MEAAQGGYLVLNRGKKDDSGGSENKPGKNPQPLVSLLECPICFDIAVPIYQCNNGHVLCHICWDSLWAKICPTCRASMSEPTRNRALEHIIINLDTELACKYSAHGCPEKMLFPVKATHQATCQFRNYSCPLSAAGCLWTGRLKDIVPHLKGRRRTSHAIPVLYGEKATFIFDVDPNLEGQTHTHYAVQIHSCLDTFFLIVFRTTYVTPEAGTVDGNIEYSAFVQHVGLPDDAKQFAYRIELERDGRRLSWEAVPLPISENISLSFEKGDCLSFNFKSMLLFKNEDTGMIPIDVTISKA